MLLKWIIKGSKWPVFVYQFETNTRRVQTGTVLVWSWNVLDDPGCQIKARLFFSPEPLDDSYSL